MRFQQPSFLLLSITLVFCIAVTSACKRPTGAESAALKLNLTVVPDHPSMTKPIVFQVHVTNAQGQPVNDAKLSAALTMKLMDMGATQLTFTPKGSGDYEASVKSTDMSGPWNLAVNAAEGGATVKQNFEVNVFD